ncbi:bifunctional diguanylate cyclase/phosphodiesterase [Shewanella frigidimarina]|uniref:bifunctional diguanylate cyclase/phosphodiesterase n=1 Tax=Shewanella frigidimarina TaxID=56812 RepID=UPI003F9FBF8B
MTLGTNSNIKVTAELPSISSQQSSIERYSTILDMVLQGLPLGEILNAIVLLIEAQKMGTFASVLLLSDDGKRLLLGAAPNFSEVYTHAINGIEIGPNVGSCGAAAFTRERVIVADIENHPNWQPFKSIPLNAGLRACWSEPIKDSKNNVLGTFAMYYDKVKSPIEQDLYLIQEAARLASLAIERSRGMHIQRLSNNIFNNLPMALVITNKDNSVLSANPKFEMLTTSYNKDLKLFDVQRFLSQSAPEKVTDLFDTISHGHAWKGEMRGLRSDSDIIYIDLTVTVISDSFTQQNCYAWLITDISARKHAAKTIDFQANHDHLTGLVNRKYLFEQLQIMIEATHEQEHISQSFSLLLMNLDHFKQINDSLGHDCGDAVLQKLAKRLLQNIPDNALLSRIGADEFVLLLPGRIEADTLMELARKLSDILSNNMTVADQNLMLSMSIGLSRFPDDANNVEQILNCASQAMYNAKAKGRNCFEFFNDKIQQAAERTAQVHLHLKNAISNNEFELFYQPIVNPFTGQIIKAEVLLRWLHDGQFISPEEFIPIAEESGLIVQIGEWVRTQAVVCAIELQQRQLPLPLSINVSTIEFWSNELQQRFLNYFDSIQQQFDLTVFPYELLTLEITESLMMKQQSNINLLLEELRRRGLNISVDDFGTGYSSLSYLVNFPVDQIKIDKSFIKKIAQGERHKAIIEAIVSMSRALDLSVIAEGVETQAELDFIKEQQIDAVQGYYFYKPMPKNDFLTLLAEQQNKLSDFT